MLAATRPALIEVGMAEVAASPQSQGLWKHFPHLHPEAWSGRRGPSSYPIYCQLTLGRSPPHRFPASLGTGVLPAAPGREAGAVGPGPGAPRRLQTFPNSRPTCHGGSRGQRRGRPGGCRGLPLPGVPSRSRPTAPFPGPGLAQRRPGPSATRSPRGEHLPPQCPGAAGPTPARVAASSGRGGSPGRLLSRARRPAPARAQLLTCRRRRSTLLSGGAPTRPGCRPLRSPPGQARGGAGASPERRNPPPGQPPPAPGSTRGRAGEGGRGGRRSPSSRTEPGA